MVFLIFLLLPHEFDGLLDSMIYGALVGLGFAMAENVKYLFEVQARAADASLAAEAFAGMVRSRVLFHGLTGHAMYTGLVGAGLGLARTASPVRLRWIGPPLGFGLAVVAHMTWNSMLLRDPLMRLIHISGPVLVVYLGTFLLTLVREREVMDHLPDAGQTPYSTQEIMPHRVRRWRALLRALQARGLTGLRAAAGLQRILIEWAYLRWHWAKKHLTDGIDPEQVDQEYRTQAKSLAALLNA